MKYIKRFETNAEGDQYKVNHKFICGTKEDKNVLLANEEELYLDHLQLKPVTGKLEQQAIYEYYATYNITSIDEPSKILYSVGYINAMEVDGVPVTLTTSYQFETTGLHYIKFIGVYNNTYGGTQNFGGQTFIGCSLLNSIETPYVECINWHIDGIAFGTMTRYSTPTFDGCDNITLYANAKCHTIYDAPGNGMEVGQDYALSNVKKIVFGITCDNISGYNFNGATSLTEITIKANSVITFSLNLSSATSLTDIYVPADLVDSYKAADGWSDYADKIKAISE